MTNDLVPVQQQMQQMTWQETMQLGDVLAKSGYFKDALQAAQAVVKVITGRELGLSPMASMTGIHIIEGKPSIGAHLMAAAIMRSGKYKYRVDRCDREAVELSFYEKVESGWKEEGGQKETGWNELGKVVITMKDAIDLGWTIGKDGKTTKANWKAHPDDMLFARAISKGYRRFCPDLTGGTLMYADGEIGDEPLPTSVKTVPAGQPIDASYTVNGNHVDQNAPVPPMPAPAPGPGPQLPDALARKIAERFKGKTDQSRTLCAAFGVTRFGEVPPRLYELLEVIIDRQYLPDWVAQELFSNHKAIDFSPEDIATVFTDLEARGRRHVVGTPNLTAS